MCNHLPKVSIGMPVYNDAKYLPAALDSLLSQSFSDFELIISDNASTDSTAEICQEYAKNEKRIRYIRQEQNLGPVANFQYVLEESQGEYFMWAACDDRRAETFLEKTVKVLMEDDVCGLVFSNYIEMNLETGEKRRHIVVPSNHDSVIYNFAVRTWHMCPSLIYGLFRRDVISRMKIGDFDFADVHFLAEVTLVSRICIIDDCLYTAGTKGIRNPYSINHKKINRGEFLRKQRQLLTEKAGFPVGLLLYFLVCLSMVCNKIILWRY